MGGTRERLERAASCSYWKIAYRRRGFGTDLLQERNIEGFQILPGKRFVTNADPFLYEYHGRTYLFYERQSLTDMRGTLWCRNLEDLEEPPRKVLDLPIHLSYPQIFHFGKYTYLLPETRQGGDIRLYKCEIFPSQWTLVDTIYDINAVDSTIYINKENEIYLFSYVDHHLEIYLCSGKDGRMRISDKKKIFTGEDSKTDRPGGYLQEEGDALWRVVQDCTDYYGQGLIVREIETLGEGEFVEHEVRRLSPDQIMIEGATPIGIHTYNRNEKFEVIDILHVEKGVHVLFRKLYWKLWNIFH